MSQSWPQGSYGLPHHCYQDFTTKFHSPTESIAGSIPCFLFEMTQDTLLRHVGGGALSYILKRRHWYEGTLTTQKTACPFQTKFLSLRPDTKLPSRSKLPLDLKRYCNKREKEAGCFLINKSFIQNVIWQSDTFHSPQSAIHKCILNCTLSMGQVENSHVTRQFSGFSLHRPVHWTLKA